MIMAPFIFWALCAVEVKAGKEDSMQDSVQLGKEVFYGKGRCGICHTIGSTRGGKCPSLDYAGSRLTRDFMYESMINPSAYVKLDFDKDVPVFYPARMPQVGRPPIGLSESQMQNVIAFIGNRNADRGQRR